jgi:hypothetical protein
MPFTFLRHVLRRFLVGWDKRMAAPAGHDAATTFGNHPLLTGSKEPVGLREHSVVGWPLNTDSRIRRTLWKPRLVFGGRLGKWGKPRYTKFQ